MSVIETLQNQGINSIWHFTDKSNLDSIERYGILSLRGIIKDDIVVSRFGADNLSHTLDIHYGLDKYVHLALIKDHPMYHRAKQRGSIVYPVWIELDISILNKDKTVFSNRVANESGSKIYNIDKIEEKIDFNKMFHPDFWTRVEARKAEIMVANQIDADKIIGVYYG